MSLIFVSLQCLSDFFSKFDLPTIASKHILSYVFGRQNLPSDYEPARAAWLPDLEIKQDHGVKIKQNKAKIWRYWNWKKDKMITEKGKVRRRYDKSRWTVVKKQESSTRDVDMRCMTHTFSAGGFLRGHPQGRRAPGKTLLEWHLPKLVAKGWWATWPKQTKRAKTTSFSEAWDTEPLHAQCIAMLHPVRSSYPKLQAWRRKHMTFWNGRTTEILKRSISETSASSTQNR